MTQNQIAYQNAQELARHNLATEAENVRHQQREEFLKDAANQISHESNIIQKEHYERMDAINATHYSNQDAYNAAMLAETARANQAGEALRAQQNAINAAATAETARHQAAQESIDSRLASNTIYRTQKEMSLISPQAGLIQAQTGRQQQETITEISRGQNVIADTTLKQAQTRTQRTQQYVNASTFVKNIYDAVFNGVRVLVPMAGGK